MTDTQLIDGLRKLCGYVEDGSATSVTISLDEATRDFTLSVGRGPSTPWTFGHNVREVLEKAITEFGDNG